MQKWIGLLDCNNFFVSCERLFRPDLKNVPVAVLSSNDGCIVARSQEVKDMQVPMGVPYFKIKDILKTNDAVLFSGNHQLYKAISKRVFTTMRTVVDEVEQYSVDEAFFYLESSTEDIESTIKEIKKTVEQVVGIPVSVGVASSKTLAKVANERAKKTTGLHVLNEVDWSTEVNQFPLGSVWGIGSRLARRLSDDGLETVSDLLIADRASLKKRYGVVGERLQDELLGKPVLGRHNNKLKQSIMSSRSFGEETSSINVVTEAALFHIEQIAFELRQLECVATELTVFILPSRYGDFMLQSKTGSRLLEVPVASTRALAAETTALINELFEAGVPYKKVGVRVSGIQPRGIAQLRLFTDSKVNESDKLQEALDSLNSKYKQGRVHQGFLEGKRLYSAKSTLKSPQYMASWHELPNVKA